METVFALLAFIHSATGYPVPEQFPQIVRASHEQIAGMMTCPRSCEAFALYRGGVIYLDQTADVEGDVTARSILLHELTHWLQDANCAFCATAGGEHRWRLREADAYEVQSRYLLAASGQYTHFAHFADPEEVDALRRGLGHAVLAKAAPGGYSLRD
jgi:hypothetical protein